jgi:hypothetical protein
MFILSEQEQLLLSNYADLYSLVIPSGNLLRRINELIDFTFVYKEPVI